MSRFTNKNKFKNYGDVNITVVSYFKTTFFRK